MYHSCNERLDDTQTNVCCECSKSLATSFNVHFLITCSNSAVTLCAISLSVICISSVKNLKLLNLLLNFWLSSSLSVELLLPEMQWQVAVSER